MEFSHLLPHHPLEDQYELLLCLHPLVHLINELFFQRQLLPLNLISFSFRMFFSYLNPLLTSYHASFIQLNHLGHLPLAFQMDHHLGFLLCVDLNQIFLKNLHYPLQPFCLFSNQLKKQHLSLRFIHHFIPIKNLNRLNFYFLDLFSLFLIKLREWVLMHKQNN